MQNEKIEDKVSLFDKPTKEAKGSKTELVRHRLPDSTTGVRGGLVRGIVFSPRPLRERVRVRGRRGSED